MFWRRRGSFNKPTSTNTLALKDSNLKYAIYEHTRLHLCLCWKTWWLFLKAALSHFIFIFLNGAQLGKKIARGYVKQKIKIFKWNLQGGLLQLNMEVRVAGHNLSNKDEVSERSQENRCDSSTYLMFWWKPVKTSTNFCFEFAVIINA